MKLIVYFTREHNAVSDVSVFEDESKAIDALYADIGPLGVEPYTGRQIAALAFHALGYSVQGGGWTAYLREIEVKDE